MLLLLLLCLLPGRLLLYLLLFYVTFPSNIPSFAFLFLRVYLFSLLLPFSSLPWFAVFFLLCLRLLIFLLLAFSFFCRPLPSIFSYSCPTPPFFFCSAIPSVYYSFRSCFLCESGIEYRRCIHQLFIWVRSNCYLLLAGGSSLDFE
jgi:hypothetical protein